jgi:MYXO-CTERM domain-containing protein
MRLLHVLAAVSTMVSAAATAHADLGPRAPCPSGTHHEYLYGHHCVANGSHLEQDADAGGMKTVSDKAIPASSAAPSAPPEPSAPPATTPTAVPAPPASDSAVPPTSAPNAPPAAAPPPTRGCACSVEDAAGGATSLLVGFAALCGLGLARRRDRRG